MISKVFFSVFVTLLVSQLALASPDLCPQPENSKYLVYKQNVLEDAPEFGRTEKEYIIPPLGSAVNCIIVTGSGDSSPSVTSVGLLDDGSIKVKLVSAIQRPFDLVLEAYSKDAK